ncbi:hypothetical protein Tco_0499986 [Tanacetum coccineum]
MVIVALVRIIYGLQKKNFAEKEKEKQGTIAVWLYQRSILLSFIEMTDAKEMWEAINLSLLESTKRFMVHCVSLEDANQKSLGLDLADGLKFPVFESDVKGSTASSSSTHNVAFVSENTSSTNDVSTAYGVSNSSGHNS